MMDETFKRSVALRKLRLGLFRASVGVDLDDARWDEFAFLVVAIGQLCHAAQKIAEVIEAGEETAQDPATVHQLLCALLGLRESVSNDRLKKVLRHEGVPEEILTKIIADKAEVAK